MPVVIFTSKKILIRDLLKAFQSDLDYVLLVPYFLIVKRRIMKSVKVEYTVQPGYIDQNKSNIKKVMDALKPNPVTGMQYSSFQDNDDPAHFIHINMATDDQHMSQLSDVKEFTEFRMALKASQPISAPKQTTLDLVGAGFNIV